MVTTRIDGTEINQSKIVDQIRCLGIDMIDAAKSGHPGIVLGAAPIIYTLYAHYLKFNPNNPAYFNRDRFVMSAGHGSALLYATLSFSVISSRVSASSSSVELPTFLPHVA